MRWRWGWRTTAMWYGWAGSHNLQRNWTHREHGDCPTVSAWREETGVWLGRRSQETLGGVWPGSMSVSRRPLTRSTALTYSTVCSFWSGLTLSPWRLSVIRGTQLPQRVGVHVPGRNSGTHGWLTWSVTNKLIPARLHVPHELLFPALDHVLGRALCSALHPA